MSRVEDLFTEYRRLAHAMQAGVAFMMGRSNETEPKHLRVGVNSAMCDHGGLVKLLIEKKVITEEEYLEAIVFTMGQEVERYTAELTPPGSKTKINLV